MGGQFMTVTTVYLLQLQNKAAVYLLDCRVAKIRHQHNCSSSVFNTPTHSRRRIFLHDILKTYISTCFPCEVYIFGKRARSSHRVLWPYNMCWKCLTAKEPLHPPKKIHVYYSTVFARNIPISPYLLVPLRHCNIASFIICVWLRGGDNVNRSWDKSHVSQRPVVTSVYMCAHGVTSSPSSPASTQRSLSSFETVTGCQECVHTDTRAHTHTRDTHSHRQRHTQTQTETHTNVDLLPTASNHMCTVLYHIYANACT